MKTFMKHYGSKFNIFKTLLGKPNPTIIEIGAHYGEDSMRFLEAFPQARVFCFEPDPRNINIFKKYITDERIKLFEIALSNFNGTADFYLSHDYKVDSVPSKYDWIALEEYQKNKLSNSGASSLKSGYQNNIDKVVVETQRFDSWHDTNNIDYIDLVWIDVQGAEKDVLDGMGDTIKKINYIWIEYGEEQYEDAMSADETVKYFSLYEFDLLGAYPASNTAGDMLFRRRGTHV